MIKPKKLKTGSKIGLVCPSGCFNKRGEPQLRACSKILEDKFNIKFILSPNFHAVDKYEVSGGTAEQRAEDINGFFRREDIDAIWCFQGGNTANEILDHLDYDLISKSPKIFTGLSDITVLLNAINQKTSLITVHSTDPKAGVDDWHMEKPYSHSEFSRVLVEGEVGDIPQIADRVSVKSGNATGVLIGGNLRCFLKLAGTQYFPDLGGKILIVEGFSVDSQMSEVLFNIAKLKQQKNFDKLSGIIVGRYYGFDNETQLDPMGEKLSFEGILRDETNNYSFPIIKSHEFGHRCPSTFLPIGGIVSFDTESGKISIDENFLSEA